MPPVKRTNADGEHDVVRLFARLQDEVFGSDLADTHAARRDLVYCGGFRLGDRGGGWTPGTEPEPGTSQVKPRAARGPGAAGRVMRCAGVDGLM